MWRLLLVNKPLHKPTHCKKLFTKHHQGSSLIEILVTLMIMAVGLLGLASMQLISMKNINNSQFRSLATVYAYDMAERMRSNRDAADKYVGIDNNNVTETDCSSDSCTSTQIAAMDGYQWIEEITHNVISGGLPTGTGTVNRETLEGVSPSVFKITVAWAEQGRDSGGGTIASPSFTLTIEI